MSGGQIDAIWRNAQWAVTEDGLCSVASGDEYFISKSHLDERLPNGGNIGLWPVQIAQKTWADLDLFWEAYLKALDLHSPKTRLEIDLDATLSKARNTALRPRSSDYSAGF